MSIGILFLRFAYIGLMAFGGGLACIPFLSHLVDELPFMTQSDLANIVALAEMTPGAVVVNMATYTGFMIAGVVGGIVATAGLILPSVLIVGCLSRLWERTKRLPVVLSVFAAVGFFGDCCSFWMGAPIMSSSRISSASFWGAACSGTAGADSFS